MPKFIINGGRKLSGEIRVSGAKNSALKILPAALLSADKITITNLPDIEDIGLSLEVLKDLGATVSLGKNTCEIELKELTKNEIDPKLANKFRSSIVFTGPMLARLGEVKFPHPGGCVIGAGTRPIDLFLEGFAAFGAEIHHDGNAYHIKAKKLTGAYYVFTKVSVTGTENLMMMGVLAHGTTTLKNCALEPEIAALADYLNSQGAKITGAGTSTITIEGVDKISAGTFEVIPDRIETGTFAMMAAATKSDLLITHCNPEHIEIPLATLKKQGIQFETGPDWIKMKATESFQTYEMKTHEYPGFPTDLQSPYIVLLTQAEGTALVHETIYDRRLLFTDMLTQMGADIITCDPHRVVVHGPTKLYGHKLISPDLRAGIAMVIAGLVAEGKTEIDNIYQIDRGYENIDERLRQIGADIVRID